MFLIFISWDKLKKYPSICQMSAVLRYMFSNLCSIFTRALILVFILYVSILNGTSSI